MLWQDWVSIGPYYLGLGDIYSSPVCEIIEYNHHETEISTVDDEFGQMILKFLLQLKISEIKPFPRAWVKMDHNLEGFVIARDGSKSGIGVLAYSIGQNNKNKDEVYSKLCFGKNRISKASMFSNEVHAITLSL